jgi:hypothetical protein
MILAKAAIIRAAIVRFGVEFKRHFTALGIIAAVFIIFHIRGDQYLFKTMLAAVFEHVNLIVLKNNFGVNPAQTGRANA